MNMFRGSRRVSGIRRFGVISTVLLRHGFGGVADRFFRKTKTAQQAPSTGDGPLPAGPGTPRRIRRVLEDLGPSFIKLGQLMSTRADMFPPDYIEEFKKLQDRVPPLPYEKIRKVLEEELPRPLEAVFADISPTPLATASVAQVHAATLVSGEKVAVKVIRPGIRSKIQDDIGLMMYFAEKFEKSFDIGRVIGAVNLVREFDRTIFRELDMHIEAGSIEKFANNFRDSDELYIGKVFWDCTTKSVLVMEHIEGIKMDRVEELRAHGLDPKEVALIGLRSFSRQLMEFGFFHADPHPGNTIVMYDGRVSLVDFGIIGYLDEEMMREIANLFLGFAEHDYDLVMAALLGAGLVDEERVDVRRFKRDLKDISEPFYGRSLQTISVKDVYDQVMRMVLKYNIRLPRNLLLLLKTFIQTEALGKILGSDASILEVTRPYAQKLLQQGYDARKLFRNIGYDARTVGNTLRLMPKFLQDLLRQFGGGKPRMEVAHTGFEGFDHRLEKGINRFTVGLVVSASLIAASLILNSSQTFMEFEVDFFGPQSLSATALLGLTGYTMATLLGVWLIVSIIRSGKL